MFKKISCSLLITALFVSCADDQKLTYEKVTLVAEQCVDCAKISLSYPKVLGETKIAKTVNIAMNEEIIDALHFDDEMEIFTVEDAMASFKKAYQNMQSTFTDEVLGWEVEIDAEILYEDAQIITMGIKSFLFTGGAHGFTTTHLLNFDKNLGIELHTAQLFDDMEGFKQMAEAKFREQEAVSPKVGINDTGFMFPNNRFRLSENLGYSLEGVQLIYNQYEVSSFADGPIILTLPFSEINQFLKIPVPD